MPRVKSREKAIEAVPSMTEAQVMAGVLEAAQMLGLDLNRQNTGAAEYPNSDGSTRRVRYGQPGNADLSGTISRGPNAGKRLDVEVKREGFDPSKSRGEERERFERQLSRLQRVNALGGIGFWTDSPVEFLLIMGHVLAGARVEEPGFGPPIVTYEPRETS